MGLSARISADHVLGLTIEHNQYGISVFLPYSWDTLHLKKQIRPRRSHKEFEQSTPMERYDINIRGVSG